MLDPSKHVGAVENIDILWSNFQQLQNYARQLEGVVSAYNMQAEASVKDAVVKAKEPVITPK
jgi:hypothetical protein